MKKLFAVALMALSTVASATSATRDHSDLWYNANEPGWGLNIAQQGNTIFATIFVQNQDTTPTWFVGSNLAHQGNNIFTGELYRVNAPFYGGTFDASQRVVTQVGTMTFNGVSVSSATLAYSVGSTVVNKNLTRQTFRTESIVGTYVGGSIGSFAGCASGNGPYDAAATFQVTQTEGGSATVFEFGPNYNCTYTGVYAQSGRYGSISGTGFCSTQPGINQTFSATEIAVTPEGLTARLNSGASTCQFTGRFGGVRRQ